MKKIIGLSIVYIVLMVATVPEAYAHQQESETQSICLATQSNLREPFTKTIVFRSASLVATTNTVGKIIKIKVVEAPPYKKTLTAMNHWAARLVITTTLIVILLAPLGLILYITRKMTSTLNQLLYIFLNKSRK